MDIESPQWDAWETRFMQVAEEAKKVEVTPDIKGARHYLCFYGENGLTPEEEFAELEILAQFKQELCKVEIETGYWQDTVLFVP